jgi:hypothetical protein
MNTFKITDLSPTLLGSRQIGRDTRDKILNIIKEQGSITIDMQNSTAITPSFLEEAIVMLVFELGRVRFKKVVELINVNPSIKILMNRMLSNKTKLINDKKAA